MSIIPGLVGPKPRQKCVGDGQQVNIPAPAKEFIRHDGASESTRTYDLSCGTHVARALRQIRVLTLLFIRVIVKCVRSVRSQDQASVGEEASRKSDRIIVSLVVRTANQHRWVGVNAPK